MSDAASDNQKSDGYTGLQIALHWAVVVLVIGQWLTSSAIPRTHNPLLLPSAMDLFLHAIHNYAGLAIGALVLLRIALRQRNLQMAVTDDARWSLRLSQAVHWALYLSLLCQAAAGFAAFYLWASAGRIHVLLWNVTLVLVASHLAATVYHAIRRDGVVSRMMPRLR
jgi:cytochrome b561